jgi:cell shape-determining protein MreD
VSWGVFALLAWLALGLELSLRKSLSIGSAGVAPSFVCCLLTILAAQAPASRVLWAGWVLGLLIDLTFMLPMQGGDDVRVLGPSALGYAAGAYVMLSMRAIMYKRSPFAMGFLALAGCGAAQLVVLFILSLRAWWLDDLAWSVGRELGARAGSSLYTGCVMTILAPLAPALHRLLRISAPQSVMGGTAARM